MSKKYLDHWKERQKDILRYLDKADIDVSAELSKLYSEQAIEAQKDLYQFYMRYATDNHLSYQEARQRLRHEDLSDYRANAERYRKQAEKDPELLKRLNEQYVSARATRLDALGLDMAFRVGVLRGLIDKTFEQYLKKSANYAYKKAIGGRNGAINAPALEYLVNTPFNGYNYSQQVWGNVDHLARDLKETLKRGFVRGDGIRELARELTKKYEVARHRAETLIRTDGTMVINNATAQRYKDAGFKYYRDLVRLDSRTTDICREIARKDERKLLSEMQPGINAAPYHFNCRTTIVPDDEEINIENNLIDTVSDNWEDISRGIVSKSFVKLLSDKYYLGVPPAVVTERVGRSNIWIDKSSLLTSLKRHGTQFRLGEFKLIKAIVTDPDFVIDNSARVENSVVLYKKIPDKDKLIMEAVVVPKADGLMIHYARVNNKILKRYAQNNAIIYKNK